MSGLEGVAAVATVAQLVAYAVSISSRVSELHERIREAPRRLKQWSEQIDQLAIIEQHVRGNPALQTLEVEPFLTAIATQEQAIQETLDKFSKTPKGRQYWKIIKADPNRKLEARFLDLKRTVDNFSLYIGSSNASEIYKMSQNVKHVAGSKEDEEAKNDNASKATEAPGASGSVTPVAQTVAQCAQVPYTGRSEEYDEELDLFEGNEFEGNGFGNIGNFVGEPQSAANEKLLFRSVFRNNTFTGHRVVHVGNVGPKAKRSHFKDNKIKGEGVVHRLGSYLNTEHRQQDFATFGIHLFNPDTAKTQCDEKSTSPVTCDETDEEGSA